MEHKLISIIIPVYNVEKYIKKCIDSLINQSYKNIEIILIDDGSTDKSGNICDIYTEKDNRVKVIHKNNNGVSSGRNTGLKVANGDYIFFMDSDDYIDSNAIEKLIESISGYNIVKMGHRLIENEKIKNSIFNNNVLKKDEFIKKILLENIGGHCWGYLIDKKLLKGVYFDENTSYMEDTLFIITCLLKTEKVKCINNTFYNHIINKEGITCSKDKILKNIHGYMYSINKIEKLLEKNNIEYTYKDDMLKKRLSLIESEVAKIRSKKEILNIIEDSQVRKVLNEIRKKNGLDIKLKYKFFIFCANNKKYFMLELYLKIRNFFKTIKNRFNSIK